MHVLHLLRHAKSSWDDDTVADHERPLSRRGVRDAERMAEHLRYEAKPDLVLCSSAVRTRQTLDLIAPALGSPSIRIEDGLYGASSQALLSRLREVPESIGALLMLGHNPGIEDLALRLAAPGAIREQVTVKYPTGALATLALDGHAWADLSDGSAELTGFTIPRNLRG
jgi:phosphohistidine phosphatase